MISKNLKLITELHNKFVEHFVNNYPNTDFNIGGCGFVADSLFKNFSSLIEKLNLQNIELKIVLATDIPNYNEGTQKEISDLNEYYLNLIAVEHNKREIEDIWCDEIDFLHVFVKVFDKKTKENLYFDNYNVYSIEDIEEDLDWFVSNEFKDKNVFDKILNIPECWSEEFDFYNDEENIQKSIYKPLKTITEEMVGKNKIKNNLIQEVNLNNNNLNKYIKNLKLSD